MMKLRIFAVFAAALAATPPTLSARQHGPYSGIVVLGTSCRTRVTLSRCEVGRARRRITT